MPSTKLTQNVRQSPLSRKHGAIGEDELHGVHTFGFDDSRKSLAAFVRLTGEEFEGFRIGSRAYPVAGALAERAVTIVYQYWLAHGYQYTIPYLADRSLSRKLDHFPHCFNDFVYVFVRHAGIERQREDFVGYRCRIWCIFGFAAQRLAIVLV